MRFEGDRGSMPRPRTSIRVGVRAGTSTTQSRSLPNPHTRGGSGADRRTAGTRLLGDKTPKSADDEASILAETGALDVVRSGASKRRHAWWMDAIAAHERRDTIEIVNRLNWR